MLKPVALAVAALVLCFCAGSASADALASASLKITSFIWYIDSDGSGDHSTADQVLTAALSGSARNATLTDNDDYTDNNVRLNVGDSGSDDGKNLTRTLANLSSPVDLPRVCVGADCAAVDPPPFNPADPLAGFGPLSPSVSGQFDNADLYLDGFYANVPGVITGGAEVGLRADVSLPVDDLDIGSNGVGQANWDGDGYFTANGDFDTYFEVQFVAQALAQLSPDIENSSARAFVDFTVQVGSRFFWADNLMNLTARTLAPGEFEQVQTGGTLYSYNSSSGMLALSLDEEYRVQVSASTRVNGSANSPPVGNPVPAPSVAWLMVAGLVGLMASRKILGLNN
jgi:hypothetical protein